MAIEKIKVSEAAKIIGASPQFVRLAIIQGTLPIGSAAKMSTKWTFNISSKLLGEYCGKNIQEELRRIREGE